MRAVARAPLVLAVLASLISGCGYRQAGRASRLPPELRTIAVPGFLNQTQTYKIEQRLTAAVVREFISRTEYRIQNDDGQSADAVLRGTVLSAELAPVTYDSETGRASSALVTVTLKVSLADRQGKVLYENRDYVFRQQYQVSREISSFFEEESPAVERLAQDFARALVSNIVEAY
ncbi:MAG: LPS assembly lipoprotein LptE [Acidobacteria bacterium]|nr:LPS assembly lipoprotein LptE [Acidobacteriota bacterium]